MARRLGFENVLDCAAAALGGLSWFLPHRCDGSQLPRNRNDREALFNALAGVLQTFQIALQNSFRSKYQDIRRFAPHTSISLIREAYEFSHIADILTRQAVRSYVSGISRNGAFSRQG